MQKKNREEEELRVDTDFRRVLTRRMDRVPKSPRTRKEAQVEHAKLEFIGEETRQNELEGTRILEEMKREQQREPAPSLAGEPVLIRLADVFDFAIQVTVQLPSQLAKVGEVLPALVDQRSRGNTVGRDGFPDLTGLTSKDEQVARFFCGQRLAKMLTGLRLAKMSKWLTFFAADLNAEIGGTRTFFVYGLAKFLGQEFGPEEESHRHLKELRYQIYAYGYDKCVGGG